MAYSDSEVQVLIDEAAITQRVRELGQQIQADHRGLPLTLLAVLKGSALFLADLARAIDMPLTLEFLGVASYGASTVSSGAVRITYDVSKPLEGRHVVVVEDIVDTGLTMKFLLQNLKARQPASIKVCALLEKPSRAQTKIDIAYRGFLIDDVFVVGYGLDHADRFRNLPFIGVMKGQA
jgi:hypoxanthine phosphoribosyltransferase